MSMTLQGRNEEIVLDDQVIESLKRIWPTKDVDRELALMQVKLLTKPSVRPVYWGVFFRNWFRKAPDCTPPSKPVGAGWWKSPEATMELGTDLGLPARPGEEMAQYRERLSRAIAEKRKH